MGALQWAGCFLPAALWTAAAFAKSNRVCFYEGAISPVEGTVYIYATFQMGAANPLRWTEGRPEWLPSARPPSGPTASADLPEGWEVREEEPSPEGRPQFLETVDLGPKTDGEFLSVIRFGLADDRRAEEKAHVTPWVSDGTIDYFGPYARPNTPYDFKIHLDLPRRRMTAWVSGRGDDEWFLLAENVPLRAAASALDHLQMKMFPGGPAVEGLKIGSRPWRKGEKIRPHPWAKKDRVVRPGRGFRFQPMRSTWLQPGKHVTIFRRPGVHAGFPDVAQAGPNHLVCVWRNGSHTGGTGGLSVAHSFDLGRTWSEPTQVTSLPGNCPRLQRLRDGTLLLLVDVPSSGDQFTATWDLVLWDSTDGGQTWTNERRLRAAQVGGGGCIVPSRIVEMVDGSWLLAASYFAPPPGGGRYVEILDYYRSQDAGQTWEFVAQPNHYPPFCLSEPSPMLLSDGRLLVYARESRTDGMPGAKGYSRSDGQTWEYRELPHPITGRTCAALLRDGRVMNTFRSGIGRAALWGWFGDPEDSTTSQPAGGHFNDRSTVGLKDGALHIDNDGRCGQFTQYILRPPDTADSTVDLLFEVQVVANAGRAATVSIPFAGKLRIFPDHAEMAHDPSLRVEVKPGRFHTYRLLSRVGQLQLFVDGQPVWDIPRGDSRLQELPWTRASIYALQFGNEARGCGARGEEIQGTCPDVYPANITPEATGYSLWRRFEAVLTDPQTGHRAFSWVAARDGFPDQYQLDHILEIEASVNGHDQGYSGWIQLDDGRIFVVHYTDDTSAASVSNPHNFGVPWIRGTFLEPSDLPPGHSITKSPLHPVIGELSLGGPPQAAARES